MVHGPENLIFFGEKENQIFLSYFLPLSHARLEAACDRHPRGRRPPSFRSRYPSFLSLPSQWLDWLTTLISESRWDHLCYLFADWCLFWGKKKKELKKKFVAWFLAVIWSMWGDFEGFKKKMGVKFQALRNLDAFPRAEEHLLQKTKSGAVGNLKFFFFYL